MRRSSVRVRLTALYSGLFIATSVVLLVNTNLLLKETLKQQIAGVPCVASGRLEPPAVGIAPEHSPAFGLGAPPRFPEPPAIGTPRRAFAAGAPPACTFVAHRSLVRLAEGVLHRQWVIVTLLIALLGIASIAFGWWLSGRVLRPLRRITETARRLSVSNLHERIALAGPPDELLELANTFDTMLARLEASVASQRSFIGNAAHELRTPLAIQRAAIQIGLDDPSPERLARVRAELLEVNRRSERLIDGLLILAQSDHGIETTEPVALDALVRQVLAETPVPNGLAIRQVLEPAIVEGDAMLLHRLVANLVHNAIRYNTPDGMVDLQVTSAGTLIVRNTGPEMPEELMGRLFEPFARPRTARARSGDSAGLGLSIVASIARAHDASIRARPNHGGGLELTVQFRAIR